MNLKDLKKGATFSRGTSLDLKSNVNENSEKLLWVGF
jgi:hypothetical protein